MNAEETMRALAAAWENGDPDAIADRYAAAGVYEGPLFPSFPVGPEAVRAACAEAFAEVTDVEVPLRNVAMTGDVCLAEGSFRCTDLEGNRTDFELVMVLVLEDGLIVRFTEYFDTAKLA